MKDNQKYLSASLAFLLFVNACNPRNTGTVHVEPTSTTPPTPESNPTPTLTRLPEITPTEAPNYDKRFTFGPYNFATTPFNVEAPIELRALLNYVTNDSRTYTAKFPKPVSTPFFVSADLYNTFDNAADDNSEGNPYFLISTSEPNHIIMYFHSFQKSSPGELVKEIGAWAYHNSKKVDKLKENYAFIKINGQILRADIVNVLTVSSSFFDNIDVKKGSPWGRNPNAGNFTFARTDILGIPNSIRTDLAPGVYYITMVSCQSRIPGEKPIFYSEKIVNRSLVTFRIVIH